MCQKFWWTICWNCIGSTSNLYRLPYYTGMLGLVLFRGTCSLQHCGLYHLIINTAAVRVWTLKYYENIEISCVDEMGFIDDVIWMFWFFVPLLQHCEAHMGQAGGGAEPPGQAPCREGAGVPGLCAAASDRTHATTGGKEKRSECKLWDMSFCLFVCNDFKRNLK